MAGHNDEQITDWKVQVKAYSVTSVYTTGFGAGAAADLQFMETAARAFGRDVLMASGGLVWSWGHEGTSTIFGNTVLATPPVPASPAPINLMWYHEGGDYTNYYERYRQHQLFCEVCCILSSVGSKESNF
ncbi:hypothetical protein EB796_014627 [Bugula neritina]|uniref:Uncharacterized protein n=1 Tax=Bugula neritina TaxID=10212 RepID=A0A7J7JNR5_BUGNE|nr:hypothetical protein EB796_014627 [Bugula neritina]